MGRYTEWMDDMETVYTQIQKLAFVLARKRAARGYHNPLEYNCDHMTVAKGSLAIA